MTVRWLGSTERKWANKMLTFDLYLRRVIGCYLGKRIRASSRLEQRALICL